MPPARALRLPSQRAQLSFGGGSGRNAYSPNDAVETYRMDMYINAQRQVDVQSAKTERQTKAFPAFQLVFEMVKEDGSPDVNAEIFSPETSGARSLQVFAGINETGNTV